MNIVLLKLANCSALASVLCFTTMSNLALAAWCSTGTRDSYIRAAEQNTDNMIFNRFANENNPNGRQFDDAVIELRAFIAKLKEDLTEERKTACITIAASRAKTIVDYAKSLRDYGFPQYPKQAKENIDNARKCMVVDDPDPALSPEEQFNYESRAYYSCTGEEKPNE